MQFFNVHRTSIGNLEQLLNDHTERGWSLHHVRGVGNDAKAHLSVLFVREFKDTDDRDMYLRERERRKQKRAVKQDSASPVLQAVEA